MTLIDIALDTESDEILIDGVRLKPVATPELALDIRAQCVFEKLNELKDEIHGWRLWAMKFANWEAQRPPTPLDWTR